MGKRDLSGRAEETLDRKHFALFVPAPGFFPSHLVSLSDAAMIKNFSYFLALLVYSFLHRSYFFVFPSSLMIGGQVSPLPSQVIRYFAKQELKKRSSSRYFTYVSSR